ncbi:hypothetical protein BN946_scf184970.g23 [Trametes cinnabarina]|uniref:Uncharacterized protein n=1 Tax=Pycnoporus cinnabarinus TaxID=5643 RepID=A0A060SD59_PYCCI|nr:hypothetical protein BN946_scf184970.g23 [Trametes cinnabarina]
MHPIYATPTPHYPALHPPGLNIQSKASSSRSQTPWGPSPVSTPGFSETTSGTLSESNSVNYDEENLVRTLGLSPQDIASADTTSWEAPSFSAWITQRRAQEAHDRFSGPSIPRNWPQPPSLNPNAGEYVPLAVRGLHAAMAQAPPVPEVGVDVLRMSHPWMAKFRSGSVATDSGTRRDCARSIVRMCRWDAAMIQELAGKFTERAMEGNGDRMLLVAPFAKAVHDAFKSFAGGVCTAAFRMHLMQCVWAEFEAIWQLGSPSSFLTPSNKWPQTYLSQALVVVSFIGELFSCHLVHAGFVYQCLRLLVSDMRVIEQLRAARVLLCRLDYHLQEADPAAMAEILEHIKTHASRIVPGQSALGEAFDFGTVKVQIDDILAIVHRWSRSDPKKVRRAPKESVSFFSSDDELEMTSQSGATTRPPSSNARTTSSFYAPIYAPSRTATPARGYTNATQNAQWP